jgi:hypothetical protein
LRDKLHGQLQPWAGRVLPAGSRLIPFGRQLSLKFASLHSLL